MPPKVSVLVPSYNHGRYLTERIESIMTQTYTNFDLIVIDDHSSDTSHVVISELKLRHRFEYLRNTHNSGTPFAAWEKICNLATGEYIWICESDDVAAPNFLEKAVASFSNEPDAVLFYSGSNIVDEDSKIIGHTDSYFHDIWKDHRWDKDFVANGSSELLDFQLRGQTVPNMSSALFKAGAFRKSCRPFLKRLRLTGDWLFVGEVMKLGRVIYCHEALNNFRKHEVTSRVRVKSARSQAEFIVTKYRLFRNSGQSVAAFAPLMGPDVIRFLYEPASWWEVAKALCKVSWIDTCGFFALIFLSTIKSRSLIGKFKERYRHARALKNI